MKFLQVMMLALSSVVMAIPLEKRAASKSSSFYYGHDISSLPMLENKGQKYYLNGAQEAFDKILISGGANFVRSRIWVNPSDGVYGLDYNLALAKRIKAEGLGFYLDFHYSDTWADPSAQTIPSGWPTDVSNLSWEVYNYTKATVEAFVAAGVHIDIVSIGNEINNGLLWPTGTSSSFSNIAQILHSAAWGVKDGDSSDTPYILVHTANGWDESTQTWFYSSLLAEGSFLLTDFDLIGFSFYPFYGTSATIQNLVTTANKMISLYGKDIVVSETDWPNSCSGVTLSDTSIPVSAAGQSTWVQDVVTAVKGLSSGKGKGVFYWEPGWVGNAALGSSCSSAILTDNSGNALSSVNMYSIY
ncbi:arabinogalactan endo-1,4-beta-galactosidase [Halteromyces radiatus]|uniref:arabinogalactan endo-1,4-beta-galactosidase n=1 Tax=Halteromyces radiatus TaxID=101107 RepID=UPI00222093B9|nr:arabinogalactan endo-1,4-beta-galactosidase [Halteromyces radiatus]KAI8099289.1 arabinogalactan endo-1,4-beta-galactosidase [Halteromyces radiatus]